MTLLQVRLYTNSWRRLVEKCDYDIDLHIGSTRRFNLSQITAYLDNPEIKNLARALGVPVILYSKL